MLGASERGKSGTTAQASGRAGEDDRSTAARHHALGHLATRQETRETSKFPNLEISARRLIDNTRWDVGTDIKHRNIDRADSVLHLFD